MRAIYVDGKPAIVFDDEMQAETITFIVDEVNRVATYKSKLLNEIKERIEDLLGVDNDG